MERCPRDADLSKRLLDARARLLHRADDLQSRTPCTSCTGLPIRLKERPLGLQATLFDHLMVKFSDVSLLFHEHFFEADF